MTHHDIEEALDAFVQARLADYDLSSDIEDAMDQYDWHSAVQGVTDDLDLASTDSVEELEEIVGRIRERQEEAAQARDAQNETIGKIARDLALCMGRDWIGLTDRMEAVEGIDTRRAPWRAKTEERLAHLDARLDAHASTLDDQAVQADRLAERIGERLEWRIAALEAVMIGQVADEDPGEAQEHQAQPDRLAQAIDAQRQALDRVCDLVGDRCGGERIICARHHAANALQALLDIHQAQQQEGQA